MGLSFFSRTRRKVDAKLFRCVCPSKFQLQCETVALKFWVSTVLPVTGPWVRPSRLRHLVKMATDTQPKTLRLLSKGCRHK